MLEPLPTCPQCGHNSLVRHGDRICCLRCPYQRNLQEAPKGSGGAWLLVALIVFGLGVVTVWVGTHTRDRDAALEDCLSEPPSLRQGENPSSPTQK